MGTSVYRNTTGIRVEDKGKPFMTSTKQKTIYQVMYLSCLRSLEPLNHIFFLTCIALGCPMDAVYSDIGNSFFGDNGENAVLKNFPS
jgi:hypothetical protein